MEFAGAIRRLSIHQGANSLGKKLIRYERRIKWKKYGADWLMNQSMMHWITGSISVSGWSNMRQSAREQMCWMWDVGLVRHYFQRQREQESMDTFTG
jgi:hypothetical protein